MAKLPENQPPEPPPGDNPPSSASLVKESAELNRKLAQIEKEMKSRNESQDSIISALTAELTDFKTKHGAPPVAPKVPDDNAPKADFWGWFKIPGL
jgi:hypothetical protein